jgi:hypothetical protein
VTLSEATPEVTVRLIGNDEGDVHCDICDRRDWWQAIEFRRADDTRTTLCLRRYEGQSCAELAKDTLFQTNIPGGDFGPATVP